MALIAEAITACNPPPTLAVEAASFGHISQVNVVLPSETQVIVPPQFVAYLGADGRTWASDRLQPLGVQVGADGGLYWVMEDQGGRDAIAHEIEALLARPYLSAKEDDRLGGLLAALGRLPPQIRMFPVDTWVTNPPAIREEQSAYRSPGGGPLDRLWTALGSPQNPLGRLVRGFTAAFTAVSGAPTHVESVSPPAIVRSAVEMGLSQEQWQLSHNGDLVPQPQAVEAAPAASTNKEFQPPLNRIAVKVAPGTTDEQKAQIASALGGQIVYDWDTWKITIPWVAIELPDGQAEGTITAFQAGQITLEGVLSMVPDGTASIVDNHPQIISPEQLALMHVTSTQNQTGYPNDEYWQNQWGPQNMGYPAVWNVPNTSGYAIVIADVDTGISAHPELAGKVCPGKNWTDPANPDNTSDDHGHGTNVAGAIAGIVNNGVGTAGLISSSYGCVMPEKSLDASGRGTWINITSGVLDAAQISHVIVLPLASTGYFPPLQEAINAAHNWGTTVVAAGGEPTTSYPAAKDHVIAAAGTRMGDIQSPSSYSDPSNDIAAPAFSIIFPHYVPSTGYFGYAYGNGNSLAAAHVAANAGILRGEHWGWTSDQIEEAMRKTAVDLGAPGWDPIFGWGRADQYAAVQWPNMPTPTPPPPTSTPIPIPTSTPPPTSSSVRVTLSCGGAEMQVDAQSQAQWRVMTTAHITNTGHLTNTVVTFDQSGVGPTTKSVPWSFPFPLSGPSSSVYYTSAQVGGTYLSPSTGHWDANCRTFYLPIIFKRY